VNLGPSLALGITCVAGIAHADAPKIEAQVELGLRSSSTSDSHYILVYDDSSSVRAAVDGLVGVRFGPVVVGLHAGITTPLRFYGSVDGDSGEIEPYTYSTIYPLDLGVAAQLDTAAGVWVSAWLGATVAFTHASSPAMMLNNIDFFGDVPAASWSSHTTSLGWGASLGYDIVRTKHGRFAAVVGVEFQGIGTIPYRDNYGAIAQPFESFSCDSITLGVAYTY